MKPIYVKIREIREELGLTQSQIASESGILQKDISRIESGSTKFIPNELIHFLYKKGVNVNLLYDEEYTKNVYLNVYPSVYPSSQDKKENAQETGNLTQNQLQQQSQSIVGVIEPKGLPLIPVEAMAGYGEGDISILKHELTYYNVPEFKEAEFLIRVKGSSMYPKYNSGDILACKYVNNPLFIQWNKVYVLDTSQGAMVKRPHPSPNESNIELRSDNKEYPPFVIPKSDIRSMALVIGVIRLE